MGNYASVTRRDSIDAAGSTNDKMFAEAVLIARPEPVVQKYGLARMYEVGDQTDSIDVPVYTNFDLTWTDLSGTGSDTGSDLSPSTVSAASYVNVKPVLKSAAISVHEAVDLLTNKTNFMEIASRAGTAVAAEIDRVAIIDGFQATLATATGITQQYAAGGFVSAGSLTAGSIICPDDLSDAKTLLRSGSINIYNADAVLLHPVQYNHLMQDDDFQAQNYKVMSKATFVNGELVAYDGMKIVQCDRIPTIASGGYYTAAGRKVIVFDSRVAVAVAQKTAGFKVRTWNDIMKHVNVKVFDIMVAAATLVPAAIVHINSAN